MLWPERLRQQVTEEGDAERLAVNSTRTRRGSSWKARRFDGKEARNAATVWTWMRQYIYSSRCRERKTQWEQGEVAGIATSWSKLQNSKCRIRILSRTRSQECWVYYWDSTIDSEGGIQPCSSEVAEWAAVLLRDERVPLASRPRWEATGVWTGKVSSTACRQQARCRNPC